MELFRLLELIAAVHLYFVEDELNIIVLEGDLFFTLFKMWHFGGRINVTFFDEVNNWTWRLTKTCFSTSYRVLIATANKDVHIKYMVHVDYICKYFYKHIITIWFIICPIAIA